MAKPDPLRFLQQKARENQEVLDLLYAIAQDMSFRRPASFLLEQVLSRVTKLMRVEAASLLLLNTETGLLDFAVVKGLNAQAIRELDRHLKPDEGLAGWVFSRGEPALINAPDADKRFQPDVDWLTGFKTRNLLAVPLLSGGKPFGVLEVLNRRKKEPFTAEDAELLTAIGHLLTTTLDNVRTVSALESAQTLLRAVIEHTEDAFVAVDARGRLTHANAAAGALFGWPSSPLGRAAAEAMGGELAQAFARVAAEGHPWRGRVALSRPSGGSRDHHAVVFPLSLVSGTGVAVLITA